jgi:hypothetical protein
MKRLEKMATFNVIPVPMTMRKMIAVRCPIRTSCISAVLSPTIDIHLQQQRLDHGGGTWQARERTTTFHRGIIPDPIIIVLFLLSVLQITTRVLHQMISLSIDYSGCRRHNNNSNKNTFRVLHEMNNFSIDYSRRRHNNNNTLLLLYGHPLVDRKSSIKKPNWHKNGLYNWKRYDDESGRNNNVCKRHWNDDDDSSTWSNTCHPK